MSLARTLYTDRTNISWSLQTSLKKMFVWSGFAVFIWIPASCLDLCAAAVGAEILFTFLISCISSPLLLLIIIIIIFSLQLHLSPSLQHRRFIALLSKIDKKLFPFTGNNGTRCGMAWHAWKFEKTLFKYKDFDTTLKRLSSNTRITRNLTLLLKIRDASDVNQQKKATSDWR